MAYSEFFGWSVFQQHDVVRVLNDPATFSNAVSTHLSAPNGMDPPEHAAYRRTIEPYFQPEKMTAFEPQCRQIAASLAQDRPALAALWAEFPAMCKPCCKAGTPAQNDIVASLLEEQVNGRKLRDDEIVSLLRNWTVGEVGTMAASVGIVVGFLCEHPDLQQLLRVQPSLLPGAIEEILRLHGPLVSNRRVTTCPVDIGGRRIEAGQRISLNWIATNRDGRVFDNASACQVDRDQSANLLWGAGIHICPGAPLARMEIRPAMEELLGRTTRISMAPSRPATWAVYPSSRFATLPVRLR